MNESIKYTAKTAAKFAARNLIGRLPRSKARLHNRLAADGGKPVRDIRFRPWAEASTGNWLVWQTKVSPAFRRIFLSGVEGLPQTRQKQFAEQWAEFCGCRYGLLLPHGTDGLRFALAAAFDHDGLDYGGEVIVPNLSFIASATCALDRRFGVALVDVDPQTLNLDPRQVEAAIVPGKTRAIMAVHQFGQPADMTSMQAIARKHGLKIIEDAAQAHGAVWESGPVGSLGDAASFSFQSAKNLRAGEGGILTTNDQQIYKRSYSLHNVGRSIGSGRWEHDTLGWNCRPTEYQAALLINRFARFEHQQAVREQNFKKLLALMNKCKCLQPLAIHPGVRRHGMYMFVMRYHPENCAEMPLDEFLRIIGAEGAPFYRCYSSTIAEQPAMRTLSRRRPEYLRCLPTPIADQAAKEIIYIPGDVFLGTEIDMEDIAAAVHKIEQHAKTLA